MFWPRLQLVELNDQPWVPASLRDLLVETLAAALERNGFIDPLLPRLEAWAAACRAEDILDLCAGSGILARSIARGWRDQGHRTRLILSDLYPRTKAWRRLQSELPEHVGFIAEPVDVTVPAPADAGSLPRLILNAFHHFAPDQAASILRSAVSVRAPIFVAEPFERTPRGLVPLIRPALPPLVLAPLTAREDRLAKALWSWSPIAPLAGLWDGLVSTLRVYTEAELRRMVEPFSGYDWDYGTYAFPRGGRGTYFQGIPAT